MIDYNAVGWNGIHFNKYDRKGFYGDTKDDIPTNAPEARVITVHKNLFVDAYHSG